MPPDLDRERLERLRPNLERRAAVLRLTRAFFEQHGFLEVDTPIRMPAIAPEAQIVPVTSDHWFLATSPELHMKRLLAAGYDKLFQIMHCFRSGERGRWHNPEFAMLEWYRAGADYTQITRDTEDMVCSIASGLNGSLQFAYQGRVIDLAQPWPRLTVREAFKQWAGWDPILQDEPMRFDEDLLLKVMPQLPPDRPTILMDFPAKMASLSRLKLGNRFVAERAEVFIGGLEIANGFSELTDPAEQRKRFESERELIRRTQRRHAPMPESFLTAMAAMPPAAGIALGLDRLVMLFCDAASIDQVMPFTVDSA